MKSLDALASLEAMVGNPAEAVRLLAASDTARHAMNYPRPPVEHSEHRTLVTALWHDRTTRSLDDTVAALTSPDTTPLDTNLINCSETGGKGKPTRTKERKIDEKLTIRPTHVKANRN